MPSSANRLLSGFGSVEHSSTDAEQVSQRCAEEGDSEAWLDEAIGFIRFLGQSRDEFANLAQALEG